MMSRHTHARPGHNRLVPAAIFATALATAWASAPTSLAGQAPSSTPSVPRTADGKPDLSGIWQVMNTANWDLLDHHAQPDVPAGPGVVEGNEIPYQSWALAKRNENFANRLTADPERKCFLPGVPRITYTPLPFQIVQSRDQVSVLYEFAHAVRFIYTDGTKHPDGHIDWYMGDSRGRWEGDTLVVDVVHFNDETWFDRAGNFHSDALHVVERYTPTGPNTIQYEATIEDPNVFTRPWKMSFPLYRRLEKNVQVLEFRCVPFTEEYLYGSLAKKGSFVKKGS